MRCTVDHDLCQGHGLCYVEAEAVFEIRDLDGRAVVVVDDIPAVERDNVRRAQDACPERAITVYED